MIYWIWISFITIEMRTTRIGGGQFSFNTYVLNVHIAKGRFLKQVGLCCTNLRFVCTVQLSCKYIDPFICWFLEPLELSNPWAPSHCNLLNLIEPLNFLKLQTNWKLEPIKYIENSESFETLNHLKPWTNWNLNLIKPLNQLDP